MRLEIVDDCCAKARQLIADGLPENELLEFMRGEIVSLRGTARAFASRKLKETPEDGPRHVRYDPLESKRLDHLSRRCRT